jgi:molybdopterin-guanine dinucleotide biosynthesis protein A
VKEATGIVGILVGGQGRRMGGVAKGMLALPGETERVAERLVRLARDAGQEVVLVGSAAAYACLDCEVIDDATALDFQDNGGPLAGLVALLSYAVRVPTIALACDLPYVGPALLARLAHHPSRMPAIAPRQRVEQRTVWEPLFARYDPVRVFPIAQARLARGERSLQGLLDEVGAEELPLTKEESAQIRDWDCPGDVTSARIGGDAW